MVAYGRLIALITASALVLGGASATAEEPDASNAPVTEGPLIGPAIPCEDNGPAGRGEAKGQSCSWSFDLVGDADTESDFLAYWVQMEIDPGPGWCAKELGFSLKLDGGTIVSAAPDTGGRIEAAATTIQELRVDGGGTAPVPGRISQNVQVAPGRVTVDTGERHYRYRWIGNSKDKVMVAIGLQLAHPGLPPEFFTSWREGQGAGMGSCRPLVLVVRGR